MRREKLIAVCLAAVLLLAGCGGGGNGGASQGAPASSAGGAAAGDSGMGWDMPAGGDGMPAIQPESTDQSGSVYQNAGAKLIRRAEMNIQTEQFDQSVKALSQMVADCGGYFETASIYGGGRRDAYANRWGEYTVRVPAEKYSEFFNSAGELGYITSSTESSDDIGEEYYDTEARLRTQRVKQERLLSLLERAETMEDIIALESALSEVEYQIEQYSSTLNRYDALVSFATFSICLNEVGQVTQEVGETASLGVRMAAGFQASFRGLVQGGQDFLVWVSYHLVLTVILAVVAGVAVMVGRRELRKRREEDKERPEE